MPELPEVETMVGRLQGIVGWTVIGSTVDGRMSEKARKKYLPGVEQFDLNGQKITGVYRRGKFIVFMTTSGALLSHNAMSGYWDAADEPWTFDYVEGKREAGPSDVRVTLKLKPHDDIFAIISGWKELRFHDARMFGSLHYVDPARLAEKLSELGPDAIDTPNLYEPRCYLTTFRSLEEVLDTKKPLKEALMDQGRVAGIGNIYAAEALWAARLSPHRSARSLNHDEFDSLFSSIRSVLEQALERKLNYDGLKVYRRKVCPRCQSPITAEKLKGRTTHWCPTCQK